MNKILLSFQLVTSMLYYKDLENKIFTKHELTSEEPDELIIISGFVGPSPLSRLKDLDFKVTVIGGMYSGGMNKTLWKSIEKIKNENENLTILFSNIEIHSKIYIWRREGKVLTALIGSANFSSNGLRNDFRESLAEATRDTFEPLNEYYGFIKINSTPTPQLKESNSITIDFTEIGETKNLQNNIKYSCDLPLYSTSRNKVQEKGGLNWGFSSGHVAEGDAYIALPKDIIRENPMLFKPYDEDYEFKGSKKKRNSEPIEIIWDDGYIMDASFEGNQIIDGRQFPKQLASYSAKNPTINDERISKKSILGRYLRKRLNVEVNHQITCEVLEKYGRNYITLSLIDDGIYYADFSV